jgi:hypothetical protein
LFERKIASAMEQNYSAPSQKGEIYVFLSSTTDNLALSCLILREKAKKMNFPSTGDTLRESPFIRSPQWLENFYGLQHKKQRNRAPVYGLDA